MIVAEKPSIGRSIVRAFSTVEKIKFETIKGKSKFNPIFKTQVENSFEYNIQFKEDSEELITIFPGDILIITSVTGHVSSFDYIPPFDKKTSWKESDPLDLIDKTAIEIPINQYLKEQLVSLGLLTTHLIIATDWDAQGESIGAQIQRFVESAINLKKKSIVTSRMRFTATNVPSLMRSFKEQFLIDEALVRSVDSLRRQDLRMGASLTRFLTVGIQNLGFSRLISYGPCQSSVLWIITNKYMEKQSFNPEPYWEISAIFKKPTNITEEKKIKKKKSKKKKSTKKPRKKVENEDFIEYKFLWSNNPVTKETDLETITKKLGNSTNAKLLSQDSTFEIINRPKPLDTDTLESECARLFRISPKIIADTAEKLYNNGLITYPRTESSYYLLNDLTPLCEKFEDNPTFSKEVEQCLTKGNPKKPSQGRFTKDHEPITPVKSVTEKELINTIKGNEFESSLAWRIYEYIVRRFFATIYLDAELKIIETIADIKGEEFVHKSQSISKIGFLELFPYKRVHVSELLDVEVPSEITIEIKDERKFTLPPELWTESKIIREMARLNIGTDATRSQHIATVIDRGYARVQMGARSLIPTDIGISFYNIFTSYAKKLILPEIRETVEKWTVGIRTGEYSPENVDENVIDLTKTSLLKLIKNEDKIFPIFSSSIKKTTKEGEEFGKCMKCNEKLILKSSAKSKRYLLCSKEECKQAYPIPKKGELRLLPQKCHACPMYPLQVGTGTKTWIFCPNCWIERQDPDGLLFCSKCNYESCPYSSLNNDYSKKQEKGKLGECPVCNKGEIIIFFDEWRTKLECNNEECDNSYKAPNIRAGTSIQLDLPCKLCSMSTLLIKRKGKAAYNLCAICSIMCFQCMHKCFG